jgi:hypothetical protein
VTPPASSEAGGKAAWLLPAALAGCALLALLGLSAAFDGQDAGPGGRTPGPGGSRTTSAVGFAGLYGLMERTGREVARLHPDDPDPRPDRLLTITSLAWREASKNVPRGPLALLILPKQTPLFPSRRERGWAGPLIGLDEEALDKYAAAQGLQPGSVRRATGLGPPTLNRLRVAPNLAGDAPVQLLAHGSVEPLVAYREGVLVGWLSRDKQALRGQDFREQVLYVLADPDVADNMGLARPGNPAFMLELYDRLAADSRASGPVVFQEPYPKRGRTTTPSPPDDFVSSLTRFPLVIAAALTVLSSLIFVWAAGLRFGAPRTEGAVPVFGKAKLIANGARLLTQAGHWEAVLDGYLESAVRQAGRLLHAPKQLAWRELLDWLDHVGRARGATISPQDLLAEAAAVKRDPQARSLAACALSAYLWKEQLAGGPQSHLRHRRQRQK